ncbi:unnamed protein product [Prunus armeniaca]
MGRTLSEQERQEERTEQELQHNENSREAENTNESNETFNILENEIIAQMLVFATLAMNIMKVKVLLMFIKQEGVKTTTLVAIAFIQTKASVQGLAKLATSTTRNRAYHFFL